MLCEHVGNSRYYQNYVPLFFLLSGGQGLVCNLYMCMDVQMYAHTWCSVTPAVCTLEHARSELFSLDSSAHRSKMAAVPSCTRRHKRAFWCMNVHEWSNFMHLHVPACTARHSIHVHEGTVMHKRAFMYMNA